MAAAGQSHADAAGDADLPAVHPAANRTGESGCAGDARQSLDPNAAINARRHHENPRQMVRLRHRHAGDPRACHIPSGLSVALTVLQAHGVAGLARDRESTGAESLILGVHYESVMTGPVPAIHVFFSLVAKTW